VRTARDRLGSCDGRSPALAQRAGRSRSAACEARGWAGPGSGSGRSKPERTCRHRPLRHASLPLSPYFPHLFRLRSPSCFGTPEKSFHGGTEKFGLVGTICHIGQRKLICSVFGSAHASCCRGGRVGRAERVEQGLIHPCSRARRSRSAWTSHSCPDGRTHRRPGQRSQDGHLTSSAGSRGHWSPQNEQITVMASSRPAAPARGPRAPDGP